MTPVTKTKRPAPGDVFEVRTPRGLAYIQYILKHELDGELIRVLPGLFETRPTPFTQIALQKEKYFVFFPLTVVARGGGVEFVANEKIPTGSATFPLMRRAGGMTRDGKVLNWFLFDGKQNLRRIDILTDQEKELSLEETWNLALLVDRISSGWLPRDEG